MAMTDEQQKFLEQIALRIPRLFDAISQGNIKSEYIIGLRCVGKRHVRLKIVAEVVDAGSNPLQTHGTQGTSVNDTMLRSDSLFDSSKSGSNDLRNPGHLNPKPQSASHKQNFLPAIRRRRPRKR
ncbi:MAG: hypothetical protein KTR32_12695 [Granulosicoccus sp.]|nr:hypothetical protein [Granulosicoccus sp.]